MRHATARLVLVTLLTLGLSACAPPESTNPLSDPATSKADKRLVGTFRGLMDNSTVVVQMVPKTGPYLDLVLVVDDGDKGAVVLTYDAFPSTIGGKTYLNLRRKSFVPPYAEDFKVEPTYIFARYAFAKNGAFSLWVMEDGPVEAAVEAGKLKGKLGDPVQLTSSSEELAAFVAATDDKVLFKLFGTFAKLAGRTAPKR